MPSAFLYDDHGRCGRRENISNDVIMFTHANLTTTPLQVYCNVRKYVVREKPWLSYDTIRPISVTTSTPPCKSVVNVKLNVA